MIALMGSQWGDDAERGWLHTLNTAAVAADGQLLLFGPYGQMARLRLVKVWSNLVLFHPCTHSTQPYHRVLGHSCHLLLLLLYAVALNTDDVA